LTFPPDNASLDGVELADERLTESYGVSVGKGFVTNGRSKDSVNELA